LLSRPFVCECHSISTTVGTQRAPSVAITIRGAWDDAFIDGIAKVYIRRPAARQIARRGKAQLEVQLCILRC
jgi:hypothetical protein